jgi:hypothetical protein
MKAFALKIVKDPKVRKAFIALLVLAAAAAGVDLSGLL